MRIESCKNEERPAIQIIVDERPFYGPIECLYVLWDVFEEVRCSERLAGLGLEELALTLLKSPEVRGLPLLTQPYMPRLDTIDGRLECKLFHTLSELASRYINVSL